MQIKNTPSQDGKECILNGETEYEIECDECDYLMCCTAKNLTKLCENCSIKYCPRHKRQNDN